MNTKEFRIGNFVNDSDDTFHTVSATYRNGIEMQLNDLRYFIDEDVVRPIKLTEEWLLMFGFEYDEETKSYSILKSLDRFDYLFEIKKFDEYFEPDFLRIQIKYVHQLQNLYFALTGVELQLSST